MIEPIIRSGLFPPAHSLPAQPALLLSQLLLTSRVFLQRSGLRVSLRRPAPNGNGQPMPATDSDHTDRPFIHNPKLLSPRQPLLAFTIPLYPKTIPAPPCQQAGVP
ncbi:hypothetical protein NMY22_g18334 [Coprinellus aureogranulatus]|nr:hypothetical protein NMY22_g18334 [Coprinellus aureogranulatus]